MDIYGFRYVILYKQSGIDNMKTKLTSFIIVLLLTGCQYNAFDTTDESRPLWVAKILATTTNDNLLEGAWSYTSVLSYENADCSGAGEASDFNGSVTYGESDAVRTYNKLLTFSDFEQKGYDEDEFQEMCVQKGGTLNSSGDCNLPVEDQFEYYLSDDGYCETYTYAGKKASDDKVVTYCGSIAIADGSAEISFSWQSDNPEKSGCKEIDITADE